MGKVILGSDGTLTCRHFRPSYRQGRNYVRNGDFEMQPLSGWTTTNNAFNQEGGQGYLSYRCIRFTNPSGEARTPAPRPEGRIGHIFYVSCMCRMNQTIRPSNHPFRFQWFRNTATGGTVEMIPTNNFNVNYTANRWHRFSNRFTVPNTLQSVNTNDWFIRIMGVPQSGVTAFMDRLIMINLTEIFGAGNEPSQAWCDENILEHNKMINSGNAGMNMTNSSQLTPINANMGSFNFGTSRGPDSTWEPWDWFHHLDARTANNDLVGIESAANGNFVRGDNFYTSFESHFSLDAGAGPNLHWQFPRGTDLQIPPEIARVGRFFNTNGGSMDEWAKFSFFGSPNVASASARHRLWWWAFRRAQIRFTNFQACNVNNFVDFWNNRYAQDVPFNITLSSINKEFMDRWYNGRHAPIIRIKDPRVRTVQFTREGDIICNDIYIDPNVNRITYKNDGTIVCRRLICTG